MNHFDVSDLFPDFQNAREPTFVEQLQDSVACVVDAAHRVANLLDDSKRKEDNSVRSD